MQPKRRIAVDSFFLYSIINTGSSDIGHEISVTYKLGIT